VLPVLGLTRSTIEVVSRMLLQRSAPPNELGALFAALELTAGLGLIVGSLLVQILIAASGPEAALDRSRRHVRRRAPSQRTSPSATPTTQLTSQSSRSACCAGCRSSHRCRQSALEPIARTATEISTSPGQHVVAQGEPGDRYYAVADGLYDVTIDGRHIRTDRARRIVRGDRAAGRRAADGDGHLA
jgi:hypothetical protein